MTTRPLSPLTMLLSRHTRRRAFITLLGGAARTRPQGSELLTVTTRTPCPWCVVISPGPLIRSTGQGGSWSVWFRPLTTPPWHENGNVGAGGYRGDAGDAGAAPSRLRRPRDSERAVAGRRGGGATPAHCGWFAMAKSNVAGFEYQYGGGTSR